MRHVIVDRAGFQYIADLEPVTRPAGHYSLRISSRWLQAKDPAEARIKLEILLDKEGLLSLRALLEEVMR